MNHFPEGSTAHVDVAGATLAVETVGAGRCVMLVHGFPHTRVVWRDVAAGLVAEGFRAAAVDLRGLGDSSRATTGYDMSTLAADLRAVIDHLGERTVHAVGIDLGAPAVFALAATHPDRVATLTVIEAAIGALPGTEDAYVRFFLDAGSHRGVPGDVAAVILDAYRGRDSLRCAFEHYRAMPAAAEWVSQWAQRNRLTIPVLAIGGDTVGEATARQMKGVADDVHSELLPSSGHIVCIDDPAHTTEFIVALARHRTEETQ
jgi:pimeloyl-ACP methyl ester carboxylesterase